MRIVVQNLIDHSERHYAFNTAEDVEHFLEVFPHLEYLRSMTHDIKDLAANICDVLGNHHLDVFTEDSDHVEDEDPWVEAKQNRGGNNELMEWAKNHANRK